MIYINDFNSVSALGCSTDQIIRSLTDTDRLYLTKRDDLLVNNKSSYFGVVDIPVPDLKDYPLHNSRNNRLMAYTLNGIKDTLNAMIEKYGHDRIGVVMGTSTSGLSETEDVIKEYLENNTINESYKFNFQEFGDLSAFVCEYLNLKGPAFTISTACSSSARSLISAYRLIKSGIADVVVAGGCDTLCQVPINGFDSMGVLSLDRCMPFCKHRSGINIGEAAGVMILSKDPSDLYLSGYGESSDAYHVSSPDPSGDGAYTSMKNAMEMAGISAEDLGYINLHGTATRLNDSMESTAVARLFGNKVSCSSTKYMTGHTLGAAGILEPCILAYLLKYDLPLPKQNFSLDEIDDELEDCGLLKESVKTDKKFMMSNSFAFGGNNASIIIGLNK
ncbi:MAG: beta-ketoacyl-ACP synthase [Succinivibrio sp.]